MSAFESPAPWFPTQHLLATMERIERINDNAPITVFEVITAAAFDLFAGTPADVCVLEVGLGGRGDATNVIDTAAACAITSISLDHRELLGPTVEIIAGEKAGIMKADVPVVIGAQPHEVRSILLDHAGSTACPGVASRPGLGHCGNRRGSALQRPVGCDRCPVPVAARPFPA